MRICGLTTVGMSFDVRDKSGDTEHDAIMLVHTVNIWNNWSKLEPLPRWWGSICNRRDWVKVDPESFSECQQPLMHFGNYSISVHANLHLTTNSSTFLSLLSQPCTGARTDWILRSDTPRSGCFNQSSIAGFPATFAAENPAAKYKQIQMYICMTSLEVGCLWACNASVGFANLPWQARFDRSLYPHVQSCTAVQAWVEWTWWNMQSVAMFRNGTKSLEKSSSFPKVPQKICLTESIHDFHNHHISTEIQHQLPDDAPQSFTSERPAWSLR